MKKEGAVSELQALEKRETAALVPLLGLVVDLNEPRQVAQALSAVRDAKRKLDSVRAELEAILADEAARQGIKTFHYGDVDVVITGGPTVEWNIEKLQELLDVGLPQERMDALIKTTVTYSVNASVAKQIAASGNEAYAEIVEASKSIVEKPWRVSVK